MMDELAGRLKRIGTQNEGTQNKRYSNEKNSNEEKLVLSINRLGQLVVPKRMLNEGLRSCQPINEIRSISNSIEEKFSNKSELTSFQPERIVYRFSITE